MKSIIRAAIAVFALTAGIVFADSVHGISKREILPHLDEMLLAANAHDTDRFMVAFVQSPELVFTIHDMTIIGWKELREQQLKWWDYGKAKVQYAERTTPIFRPLGQDLVVTVQSLTARTSLPDGTTRNKNLSFTAIWKKLPQGWRIVVAHESFAT